VRRRVSRLEFKRKSFDELDQLFIDEPRRDPELRHVAGGAELTLEGFD